MDIAVCINKNFIQHFHAMLTSVVLNSKISRMNIHIVHSDLDMHDYTEIQRNFERYNFVCLNFYKIDKQKFNGITILNGHLSVESLYRLELPNILPSTVEKVIYLDADIIVLEDLDELYTMDLSKDYLAACNEYYPPLADNLNLCSAFDYFNAGVLVLNLAKWRKDNFTATCLEYAKITDKTLYCLDQDILNSVLNGNWVRLDMRWNLVKSFFTNKSEFIAAYGKESIEAIIKKPKIVHYSDYSKPWHYLDEHPMKSLYQYYLVKSGFKTTKMLDEEILKNAEIYLFGTGQAGISMFNELNKKITISGFIDNDINKVGKSINGVKIFAPFKFKPGSIIVIASQYVNEISEQLDELGFNKGITYFTGLKDLYINLYNNREIIYKLNFNDSYKPTSVALK